MEVMYVENNSYLFSNKGENKYLTWILVTLL